MSVAATTRGSVCLLTIDGELLGDNAQQFRELIERAFAADNCDFVVDFGKTTAIDSQGLEVLTWLRRECDEQLGMVRLCCVSEMLRKILEVTRVERHFEQHDQLDDALKSFV